MNSCQKRADQRYKQQRCRPQYDKQRGVAEVEISVILLAAMILSLALVDLAQPGYQQQRLQQLSEDLVWLVSSQRDLTDFDVENNLADAQKQVNHDQYKNLAEELWSRDNNNDQEMPQVAITRLRHQEAPLEWDPNDCGSNRQAAVSVADLSRLLQPLANGQRPAVWVVTVCLEQKDGLSARWFNSGGNGEKAFPVLSARSVLIERDGY